MLRRWLALLAGAALAVTASAVGVGTAAASRPAAQSYDKILKTSIRDIQDFWSQQMPAVYGVRYAVLPASHIHAYTAKTDMSAITECARGGATYKDFKHNAFHCPLDMTVNYDNQDLFPGLYKRFGAFALAQVLSHEWGHVIQTQTGTEFPATVLAEQQADCFAGAWVEHVDNGGSKVLKLDPRDLDKGLAGMLEFSDPIGGDPTNQGCTGPASTGSTRSSRAPRRARNAAPNTRRIHRASSSCRSRAPSTSCKAGTSRSRTCCRRPSRTSTCTGVSSRSEVSRTRA